MKEQSAHTYRAEEGESIVINKSKKYGFWNNQWVMGIGVTVLGGLILLILSPKDPQNLQTSFENSFGGIQVDENNGSIQVGNNNIVTGSIYKDEQDKIWDDAYVPIQDFFTRLNNKNYEGARQLLDKQLINNSLFSTQELQHFMTSVDGSLTVREPRRDEGIKKDTEYVSNRGFYVYLRYLKSGKQVNEGWRITSIKYNKEDNLWKIGEMRCEDKRCQDESLLAEINF